MPFEEQKSIERSLAAVIETIVAVPGEGISEGEMARHLINIFSPEEVAEMSVNQELLDIAINHHFHIDMEAISINDKPAGSDRARETRWLRDFTHLWDRINQMARHDQVRDLVNISALAQGIGVDEHMDDDQLLHHLRSTPNWSPGSISSQTPTSTPPSTSLTQPYIPSTYKPNQVCQQPDPPWTDSPPKKKTKAGKDPKSTDQDMEMDEETTAETVALPQGGPRKEQSLTDQTQNRPDTEMTEDAATLTKSPQESPQRKKSKLQGPPAEQRTAENPNNQGAEARLQLEQQRAEARALTKKNEEARTQAKRAGMEAGHSAHANADSDCPTG